MGITYIYYFQHLFFNTWQFKNILCHDNYNKAEEVVVDFFLSKRLNKSNEGLKIKKKYFFVTALTIQLLNY